MFQPLTRRLPVSIPIVDDNHSEPPQQFTIQLFRVGLNTRQFQLGTEACPGLYLTVTIIDDDRPGFILTGTEGLRTTEGGGTASFEVAPAMQPSAPVTVTPAKPRPGRGHGLRSAHLHPGHLGHPADRDRHRRQ